uniref:Uncharacterized protein n=1 Tax=Physcomitrium patens TaxID=3218 RepID=A0A2K1INC7_PHYPA|nr:hypothetical protein PHYPA_027099 [Physcomitrium patens]
MGSHTGSQPLKRKKKKMESNPRAPTVGGQAMDQIQLCQENRLKIASRGHTHSSKAEEPVGLV